MRQELPLAQADLELSRSSHLSLSSAEIVSMREVPLAQADLELTEVLSLSSAKIIGMNSRISWLLALDLSWDVVGALLLGGLQEGERYV